MSSIFDKLLKSRKVQMQVEEEKTLDFCREDETCDQDSTSSLFRGRRRLSI